MTHHTADRAREDPDPAALCRPAGGPVLRLRAPSPNYRGRRCVRTSGRSVALIEPGLCGLYVPQSQPDQEISMPQTRAPRNPIPYIGGKAALAPRLTALLHAAQRHPARTRQDEEPTPRPAPEPPVVCDPALCSGLARWGSTGSRTRVHVGLRDSQVLTCERRCALRLRFAEGSSAARRVGYSSAFSRVVFRRSGSCLADGSEFRCSRIRRAIRVLLL